MKNEAEEKVLNFYNNKGWNEVEENTEDAVLFEDLRPVAKDYIHKCRLKLLKFIPDKGENILDMASGPIQYEEYLEYSKNFKKRHCVDLSKKALESAKKKIGDHGVFYCGSWFDINFKENFFDCSLSLHTIYHIDKEKQEKAIRKLINVTKPGKPVIIIYSNPITIMYYVKAPLRTIKKILKHLNKRKNENNSNLYFYSHPLKWWDRFNDIAKVTILPWRSFSSEDQKRIIPNNILGKKILKVLLNLEKRYPRFFANKFQYPMIIIMKNVEQCY